MVIVLNVKLVYVLIVIKNPQMKMMKKNMIQKHINYFYIHLFHYTRFQLKEE